MIEPIVVFRTLDATFGVLTMKTVTLLSAFVASLLTSAIHALELIKRDGPPAVIALPIEKRALDAPGLHRRASSLTVAQTLDNFQVRTQQ